MFEKYLSQWQLVPDGEPIVTPMSRLLPVRMGTRAAMLKVAMNDEEKYGGALLRWWNGEGAAQVYEYDGDAILMERARDAVSLLDMAENGEDDAATRILCSVVDRLHAPRGAPPPNLVPLPEWFTGLWAAAAKHGGAYARAAEVARELHAAPREVVPLHADIHHRNVLDFAERGWLAIDPKRVIGDRGYEYANIFTNPELSIVAQPERFARQLEVVTEAARIERSRLLRWIIAYAGLSAAWFLEDDDEESATQDMAIAAMADAALAESGGR